MDEQHSVWFFFKIKLEEVYETPTQFFMVLELVTGGELFDRSALG